MAKVKTSSEKGSTYRIAPFVPDMIPPCTMSRGLWKTWEAALRRIRAAEGEATARNWFAPLRYHGMSSQQQHIFSAPAPFLAGQLAEHEWTHRLLSRNLQREMGSHRVMVDSSLTDTPEARMAWEKKYFAKYKAEPLGATHPAWEPWDAQEAARDALQPTF